MLSPQHGADTGELRRLVYEWDSRPDRAIEFACRVAGRDFTEQEWAQEFGTRPYQHTCP